LTTRLAHSASDGSAEPGGNVVSAVGRVATEPSAAEVDETGRVDDETMLDDTATASCVVIGKLDPFDEAQPTRRKATTAALV
jgi:hypothetical protein